MANQVQCPNCGGYKVSFSQKDIFEKRAYSVYDPKNWKGWHLVLIFLAIVLVLMAVGGESLRLFIVVFCSVPLILSLIIFIPKLLWAIIFQKGQMRIKEKSGVLYNFSCQLCGYKWEWSTGQPEPEIHVRPDLIAKGEQRLREEEERRRKQQEDAAALYYLTHQGKK